MDALTTRPWGQIKINAASLQKYLSMTVSTSLFSWVPVEVNVSKYKYEYILTKSLIQAQLSSSKTQRYQLQYIYDNSLASFWSIFVHAVNSKILSHWQFFFKKHRRNVQTLMCYCFYEIYYHNSLYITNIIKKCAKHISWSYPL